MFTLYKASGARVPDLVSDIGAGSTLGGSPDSVVSGLALQISSGALEKAATNAAVAGICAADYSTNASKYAAASGTATATFPNGLAAGTKIPFLPVTGTVPIKANVSGTVAIAAAQPGATLDIDAAGTGLTTSTNGDFRVVKLLEDDGTNAKVVVGFFTEPGYFTA